MEAAAKHHEHMPDGVAEGQPFPTVEDHPRAVKQAADQQEPHGQRSHLPKSVQEDQRTHPAQQKVQPHRWLFEA